MQNDKTKIEIWKPWPAQEPFHQCAAYEAMFGGTKGPGKTDTLLRESTRQLNNKSYRAVIFRRTYPRLGEVIDRSFKYFLRMGLEFSGKDQQIALPSWTAPSGAKICFGHIQHEQDKYNWQGKEFHFIGFDEVEEFTETQYLFLVAQNRTSDKSIRCYVRSTANPGGIGHGWVKRRFIDPFKTCQVGFVKYFTRNNDEDVETTSEDPKGISRAFIPASVYDNPSIIQNDPEYVKRLEQLPEQDKQALLYGNWDVFKGQFFNMWRKQLHIQDWGINKDYLKFIALDYGYTKPSAVGWWQVDFDGRLNCYRELYGEGRTYESLAKEIIENTPKDETIDYLVYDPAIDGDRQRHTGSIKGESGSETMRNVFGSFTRMIKADNSRVVGWGRMKQLMTGTKPQDVRMSWNSRCKHSTRTIPELIYADTGNPEDCNTDGEDHAGDMSRYGAMSRPIAPVKKEAKPWDHLPLKDATRWERIQADFDRNKEEEQSKQFLEML